MSSKCVLAFLHPRQSTIFVGEGSSGAAGGARCVGGRRRRARISALVRRVADVARCDGGALVCAVGARRRVVRRCRAARVEAIVVVHSAVSVVVIIIIIIVVCL